MKHGGFMKSLIVLVSVLFLVSSLFAKSPAKLSITAKDIKEAMKKSGSASWVPKDNNLWDNFSNKENPFGLIEEDYGFTPSLREKEEVDETLPKSIDWRNNMGKNWLSPIKDQGRCGSCVAFAVMGMIESAYNIQSYGMNYDVNLSEQYLFACGGAKCTQGWYLSSGLDFMKKTGAPDEVCAPYLSGNMGADFSCSSACSSANSRKVYINSYKSYGGYFSPAPLNDIKKALQAGPMMSRMTVYEDFMLYSSGVYKHVTGGVAGGHAITIVGYNDDDHAFIVRNSWGPAWGENGYFRIDYDDISGVGSEAYQIVVPDVINFIKIESPIYRELQSGVLTVKAIKSFVMNGTAKLIISEHGKEGILATVNMVETETNVLEAEIDTEALNDNEYDIRIEATDMTGAVIKSDYTGFISVNNEPENAIKVSPMYTGTIPATAPFKIECDATPVPIIHADISITGPDSFSKKATREFPCPAAKLNIKTTELKAGTYKIVVKGQIGVFEYTSNELEFTK